MLRIIAQTSRRPALKHVSDHRHVLLSKPTLNPPRMTQTRRFSALGLEPACCNHDLLHETRVEWAKARRTKIIVDPIQLSSQHRVSDTTLDRPWRYVEIPPSHLEHLSGIHYVCASSSYRLWGIGKSKPAENSNPHDIYPSALQDQLHSRRPGQGPFTEVVTGPYGDRYSKYLFVIDHLGMHIIREMTPCDFSSRGIPLHSLMKSEAVIGGEIFFDTVDKTKVFINFGSARFPVESNFQAEKVAEFVLALGYQTVVTMIPNRDLRDDKYGMGDRYGKDVPNVVFKIAPESNDRKL